MDDLEKGIVAGARASGWIVESRVDERIETCYGDGGGVDETILL